MFFSPLWAKGTADSVRKSLGLEAKRKSPPRARQIPQPAGWHDCFLAPFGSRVPRTQSATRPALRPNDRRPRWCIKCRSPQGCMNVFQSPLGQGAASAASNSPGLEAKRLSPPRARQIPQPARLHECFLAPFGPRCRGRSPQTTRPKAVTTDALESALTTAALRAA